MIQQQLEFHQNVFGYQALLQHISYIQQKKRGSTRASANNLAVHKILNSSLSIHHFQTLEFNLYFNILQ